MSAIKKQIFLFILLSSLVLLPIHSSKAQFFIPGIINQDQISRIQDRELQKKQIDKEIDQIKRKKIIKVKQKPTKKEIDKIVQCFEIKEFEFSKSKLISQEVLSKISNPHLNKCFSVALVNEIKNEINVKLHEKGYITSQATLPQQNVSSGIVKINIIQGKINKVQLNDDKFFDKIQKFLLFGDLDEEVLDVKKLNQGLYQMNKLPSSNAKIKIIAADKEKYSDVILSNQYSSSPVRGSIAHDNLGNNFTGIRRTTFSSSADNLLSLSENINVSFTNNLNDNNNKKEMESVSTSIAIPFRYYTISYNYSDTDYMGKVDSENGIYTVNGYARRKTLSLQRSLINQEKTNLSTSISLIQKNIGSETLLIGTVDSNQRRLSILDFSISISNYSKYFNIYLKPTLLRGLKQFDATKDQSGQAKDSPHSQFTAYRLYFNISKPVALFNNKINLSSEFDSQVSQETLYGSEQFSVGGYYSVRGFRENYISGDHGYYSRSKASINLGKFISPKFTFETFFDYGAVKDKIGSTGGRLSGAGANLIYNSKYFNTTLSYANSLTKSKLFDSSKKENHLIYFQTTLSL